MKIVLFSHPSFLPSQSMPRYAAMLSRAFQDRGHEVETWSPAPLFHALAKGTRLAKWAGYVDQYLVFPWVVRLRLLSRPAHTLFVFCDQALGPWVPLVTHRPHVVHAHDLLALRSALGLIPENPTSGTGRIYQRYIRSGFRKARHFIAISGRTRDDLVEHASIDPSQITVVHNGLNHPYQPTPAAEADALLQQAGLDVGQGFLLHVGGSQWYKNTRGLIHLYGAHARRSIEQGQPILPLIMVSPAPNAALRTLIEQLPPGARVHFCQGINTATLQAAYSRCRAFLFPSLAEGFGWPIIEAQACGALVLTTDDGPMNEIGGPVARYASRLKLQDNTQAWADQAEALLQEMLNLPEPDRSEQSARAVQWAARFKGDTAIQGYLAVYEQVLQAHGIAHSTPTP